ncbi:MAG: protein TolQ [Proteobacteria bacterium]|nr:protein TolQ [Pseudomonadota bacterium]
MLANAGPMVKMVLLLLLGFSILSWAIIIHKLILLRKVESETAAFYDLFWKKEQLEQVAAAARNYKKTPLSHLFMAVYSEFATDINKANAEPSRPGDRRSVDRMQRLLKKTGAKELARIEYAVPFLATSGNTAPFIGLFGTVWGIMNSFRSIGAKGAANLAVVAPGISEALVATAMGLLVAIPAVVGYNFIVSRTARIASEMESFSSDLINVLEKRV